MQFVQNTLNFGKISKYSLNNSGIFIGFLVRTVIIILFSKNYDTETINFIEHFIVNPSLDPWIDWYYLGNEVRSFPFGYTIIIYFSAFFTLGSLIGIESHLSYGIALLIADYILLITLRYLLNNSELQNNSYGELIYWLNPVTLILIYIIGLNDIVIILLLLIVILLLVNKQFVWAPVVYFLAIISKASILITWPIFILYFFKNRHLNIQKYSLVLTFSLSMFFAFLLINSIDGLKLMLNESQELGKLFAFTTKVGNSNLYWTVIFYMVLLFWFFKIKFANTSLFISTILASFILILISADSSYGWFIWASPLLIMSIGQDKYEDFIFYLFQFVVLIVVAIDGYDGYLVSEKLKSVDLIINKFDVFETLLFVFGAIYAWLILKRNYANSDPFKLNSSPIIIGIAGDSSTGKDTIVDSLENILCNEILQHISGDDYHLWDRKKDNWKILTHLNPKANDLYKLEEDILKLKKYKPILKRHYDHSLGKMTKEHWMKQKEIIITSGLHSLMLPNEEELFDTKIYVEIEKNLRYALKIKRDTNQRGKSIDDVLESLLKRENDSVLYIEKQRNKAHLNFRLETYQDIKSYNNFNLEIDKFKLNIRSKNLSNYLDIHKLMIGLLGLDCIIELKEDGWVEFTTNCNVSSDQIALCADILLEDFKYLLREDPVWENNSLGLIQLFIICQIENNRRINTLR